MKIKFAIITLLAIGIPFALYILIPSLEESTFVRIIIGMIYLYILYIFRIIQITNNIGIISSIPNELINNKDLSQQWLDHVFKSALYIFIPSIFSLIIFQYFNVYIGIDIFICIAGSILWAIISYAQLYKL